MARVTRLCMGVASALMLGTVLTTPATAQSRDWRSDERGSEMRMSREEFDRGYRRGRADERLREAHPWMSERSGMRGSGGWGDNDHHRSMMGRHGSSMMGPEGAHHGVIVLMMELGRRQEATRQLQDDVREVRNALQQNDRQRAEQALSRMEQRLQSQERGQQARRDLQSALDDADRAIRERDRDAAREALQEARDAMNRLSMSGDRGENRSGFDTGMGGSQGSTGTSPGTGTVPGLPPALTTPGGTAPSSPGPVTPQQQNRTQ